MPTQESFFFYSLFALWCFGWVVLSKNSVGHPTPLKFLCLMPQNPNFLCSAVVSRVKTKHEKQEELLVGSGVSSHREAEQCFRQRLKEPGKRYFEWGINHKGDNADKIGTF